MSTISHLKSGLRVIAIAPALVLFACSARPVDGNAVAARLKALYAEQGGTIEYGSVETNGSTVVLKDAKVSTAGVKESFNAGDVTLNDVSDVSDGGFKIGSLTMPDIDFSPDGEPENKVSIDGISLQGITLPAEGATEPLAKMLQYGRAEVKHLNVNAKGKDVFTADNLTATISPLSETSPVTFSSNVESFKADLSDVDDPKTKDALKALGYETISGKIAMNGTWSLSDGRLNFEKMDFIADNAGTLGLTFDISGYTLDFIKGLQEATKNMEGKPDDAQGMAMLGLMQQLSFTGASIRFEDASVTNKALDYVANQQGTKRGDLISQAKAIISMVMAQQLGNAELAQSLGDTVASFLENPKTIAITAAPEKAIPFAIIVASGMADPKSLIKMLHVKVTASD